MIMSSKIADRHLSRQACIYIRQSTMGQVRFHQESTERQYNLMTQATSLGWRPEQIRVLDRDLGQSGARTRTVSNDTLTEYVAGTRLEKTISRPSQRQNMARFWVSEPSFKTE